MNTKSINNKLFSFLKKSPTPFHAVDSIIQLLDKAGFSALSEKESWTVKTNQPYYVVRDDGALVAFNVGSSKNLGKNGFRIAGAHSDSPCLQIKPKPDLIEKSYHKLAVEVYGSALLAPWFDRELSIAGRVCYKCKDNSIATRLIDFDRPVAMIPSLAIHLDREANSSRSINAQKDITPIIGLDSKNKVSDFTKHLKNQLIAQYKIDDFKEILSFDLFCYDLQGPSYSGIKSEFIGSSRLDNLLSCFVATQAVIAANTKNNFMFVCNNHEEVGSNSSSGAQGNLALSVFERLIPDIEQRHITLANSLMLSIDNAHATHPNFQEKSDPSHSIQLNLGPVIKINSNQRYASNSLTNSIFKQLCNDVNIPYQEFVMRNDMACGSTIGPMTSAKLGIRTIDIGAASLAMHSIRELTGSKDPALMLKVIEHFFQINQLPQL